MRKIAKANAIKTFNLLKSAPQELRNKLCLQFKSIISNTEVIEIEDSDEEESVAKASKVHISSCFHKKTLFNLFSMKYFRIHILTNFY